MKPSCGCPSVSEFAYFVLNDSHLTPIRDYQSNNYSQQRLLKIEVCPRCGYFVGTASRDFISEYTAPPYCAPSVLKKIITPDAEDIRRLPGTTTLQSEEAPYLR